MAVASGMPVGPEGPVIHIAAALGAGVSQGRSRTLGCASLPTTDLLWSENRGRLLWVGFRLNTVFGQIFAPLQSHRVQHDFITAGCAAGIATAFGAPIGGLLFVMVRRRTLRQLSIGSILLALYWVSMLSLNCTDLI